MVKSFIKFSKGMLKLPAAIQIWLLVLMCLNMIVPFFYISRFEAQITVVTFMASAMFMVILTAVSGFTRLLGLGHILWIPLIIFLWTRFDTFPPDSAYGLWIRGTVALNAVSLLLDAIDVIRYIRGDRRENVQGL